MLRHLIIITLVLVPTAWASDWDEFTDNLATDLAPLISLFGERLTKQFLSESISLLDNFIFAAAPLGILTAVVSVIRVCGNPSLRAFVGRAQEGPGEAENELLSCVSETTGELFNEGGISRVFGRPRILEVVVWEDDSEGKERSKRIGTLREALQQGAWVAGDGSVILDEKGYLPELDIPNLSLNKGIERRSQGWFYCAAVLGLVLQAGVLVYSAVTVFLYPDEFLKDDERVEAYAFPLFLFGSLLLCTGMFLCAFIIERASTECYLRPAKPSKLYWLQPGKQNVGDQAVGAFLGVTEGQGSKSTQDLTYIKSIRGRGNSGKGTLLIITIAITIAGFVAQFVGLRGLHASVTLAQMGSTLVMAIVRTSLRTKRIGPDENRFEQNERQLASHKSQELDSFAFHLEDVESFSLVSSTASGASGSQSSMSLSRTSTLTGISTQPIGSGTRLVEMRARLAELTSDGTLHENMSWDDLPIRKVAQNLAQTIEMTMDLLSAWNSIADDTYGFELSFACQSRKKSLDPIMESYTIKLERSDDTLQWRVNDNELEAVLGLATWSLLKSNPDWLQVGLGRLVGLNEHEARAEETDLYFHKWIHRLTEAKMVSSKMISLPQQMFGFYSDEYTDDKEILVVKTENEIEDMIAQDIYIQFLKSALGDLKELGGSTDLRPGSQNRLLAHNSRIDELVNCVESSNLGSKEDALLCIVPVLRNKGLLPELAGDSEKLRTRVEELIASNNWPEAFALLRWLCERSEGAEFEQSMFELGYLCRRAMVHVDSDVQSEGFRQACLAVEYDPRAKLLQNAMGHRPANWMNTDNFPEHWKDISVQLGWVAWHIAQRHCDRQTIHATLESFGVNEHSVTAADANNCEEQGKTGEQTVLQWLTNSDDKLFSRQLPGMEDRLALDWVCQNGHHPLMNWLFARWVRFEKQRSEFIFDILLWAAEGQYRSAFASLKRHGVSLDLQGPEDGATALIQKVAVVDRSAVHELLEAGADANGRDARGATPLMTASHVGDMDTVLLLLQKGANVNTQDLAGLSPLIWSTAGNNVAIAQTLLDHGAHVNLGSYGGSTPLIAAAAENQVDMMKLLISRGADINVQTGDGCSALTLATRNKCTEAQKVLLDNGALIHRHFWTQELLESDSEQES